MYFSQCYQFELRCLKLVAHDCEEGEGMSKLQLKSLYCSITISGVFCSNSFCKEALHSRSAKFPGHHEL